MAIVNKSDLAAYLHYTNGLPMQNAERAVMALFSCIETELLRTGEVKIHGLGRLYIKPAKIINIAGVQQVKKAHIKFTQSKLLKL